MYQAEEYESNRAQLKRRTVAVGIPGALLLGGIIYTLCVSIGSKTVHLEWLTTTLTIVLGAMLLFVDAMAIAPVRAYGRHLNNVLHGRTRVMEGLFKSFDQETCLREGVTYHAVIISQGDLDDGEDDRLFYYDALKPDPPFEAGDRVRVTFHDRDVADIERL